MGWVVDVARMREMPTNFGQKSLGDRQLGNHTFTPIFCFLLQRERKRDVERGSETNSLFM
jgi:hypothetical protein